MWISIFVKYKKKQYISIMKAKYIYKEGAKYITVSRGISNKETMWYWYGNYITIQYEVKG